MPAAAGTKNQSSIVATSRGVSSVDREATSSTLAASQSNDGSGEIVVEGVWKAFRHTQNKIPVIALSNTSFEVKAGEFVCVCGPSGCGKSTLLRILAGLDQASKGSVTVGAPGSQPAMVFQESSIFPWLTVEENVAYPLKLAGIGRRERRRQVEPIIKMMKLEKFRRSYPHQLSGGMKQRVSVARALVDDRSQVLLMDEPFGALDEQTRVQLQQELLRIWERHRKTVVFITHSVDEALTLGDRVIVMSAHPGRIIADIPVSLPRPRNALELRRDAVFGELTYEIWRLLEASEAAEKEAAAHDRS